MSGDQPKYSAPLPSLPDAFRRPDLMQAQIAEETETLPEPTVFSPEDYRETYPDLKDTPAFESFLTLIDEEENPLPDAARMTHLIEYADAHHEDPQALLLAAKHIGQLGLKTVFENTQLTEEIEQERELRARIEEVLDKVERELSVIRLRLLEERGKNSELERKTHQLTEQRDHFQELAYTDALTGLPNRHSLERVHEAIVTTRSQTQILFIDIDEFKKLNDSLGHKNGDVLITDVGKRLRANLRTDDFLGRYGGDEFMAFLFGASPEEALQAAEKLRIAIEEDVDIGATVSIGVDEINLHVPLDEANEKADAAMKQAKREGRNRTISVHQENTPTERRAHDGPGSFFNPQR